MKVLMMSALFFLFGHTVVQADAVYDGSMGTQGTLAGNFIVPEAAGNIQGSNLFHSFSRFDILTGESATFTGSSNISAIISRVTGGAVSTIDGLLDSATSMPNANFYFINSAGIVFNANAKLQIGGAFFASTANHVVMADASSFSSTVQVIEVFSNASPVSFGFLAGNVGTIQINGAVLAGTQQAAFSNISFSIGASTLTESFNTQVNAAFPNTVPGPVTNPFATAPSFKVNASPNGGTPANKGRNRAEAGEESSNFGFDMNKRTRLLDAGRWAHQVCEVKDSSHFSIKISDAAVHTPNDWQASPLFF